MATAALGTYLPNPLDPRLFSMDISSYQGAVDFQKTKNNQVFPKITAMMARTGISWGYKDSWFETYWAAFRDVLQVKRLAYHVHYPLQPVQDQINNMKSRFAGGVFDGDGLVWDVELKHDATRDQMTKSVYEAVNRLRDWGKKPVFIYTRFGFVEENFNMESSFYMDWYHAQLWHMAQYYKSTLAEYPTASLYKPAALKNLKVAFHQTGAKGDGKAVGMVSAQVDTNRWCLGQDYWDDLFGADTQEPVEHTDAEKLDILWGAHPELHTR